MANLVLVFYLLLFFKGISTLNIKCPDGWTGFSESLSCYKFMHHYPQTWEVANKACQSYKGDLVVINNKPEKDWIATRLGEYDNGGNDFWWLGFKFNKDTSSYLWLDTRSINPAVTPWENKEPDGNAPGFCGGMNIYGNLLDSECSGQQAKYICERALGEPVQCGSGWDHYGDSCYKYFHYDEKTEWSMARSKCKELKADLVIVDSIQENLHLFEFAKDNEIDVWIGAKENPCPSGWGKWHNHCYGLNSESLTFDKATEWCRANQTEADLVSIHSKEENDFVVNIAKGAGNGNAWIGYFDYGDAQEGKWEWTDGTNSSYTYWYANEPNGHEKENCAELYLEKGGKWNDKSCDSVRKSVCKMPAPEPGFIWVDGTPATGNNIYQNWFQDENEQQPIAMDGVGRGVLTFMTEGRWSIKKESEENSFVCEKQTGDFCQFGMIGRKKSCYDFYLDSKVDVHSWEVARGVCTQYGMDLVVIENQNEDEWINNYLLDTGLFPVDSKVLGMWIGLKETENNNQVFNWVNGKSLEDTGYDGTYDYNKYSPDAPDCFWQAPCNHSHWLDCPEQSDVGQRWINDVCDEAGRLHFSACEIGKGQMINLTGVFNPKEYCPEGWSMFAGYCYLMGQEEDTWAGARTQCKANQTASDLASIHSPVENDHILQITKAAADIIWLGLSDRMSEGQWLWVDGSSGNYMHWDKDEPNGGRAENCAEMRIKDHNGKWNDKECTQKRPFVCKVKATLDPNGNPDLPDTSTQPSSPNCGDSWYGGWVEDPTTGMCYQLLDMSLSWADSREECKYRGGGWDREDHDGELASINTFAEQTFLEVWLGSISEVTNHWIGLNDQTSEGGYVWSDGSPVAYVNWHDGEPNDYGDGEDCTTIVVGNGGSWNDDRCEKEKPAVCEKKGWNYHPPPDPKPPTVSCQEGWLKLNDKCFFISGDSKKSNWTTARQICKGLNPLANLASILSKEEVDFIYNDPSFTSAAFIGGSDADNEGTWTWLDNSQWQFENWGANEPNGGDSENCLEMVMGVQGDKQGYWNDIRCESARSYICSYLNVVCPEGWYLWNAFCFYSSMQDEMVDLETARQSCRDAHPLADLASIHDEMVNYWLKKQQNSDAFIGLQRTGESFGWLDGSVLDYTNWMEGQPDNSEAKCAVMTKGDGDGGGLWKTSGCNVKNNFHCKLKATSYYGCPAGWEKFRGYCYLLQDEVLSWDDANAGCVMRGGNLASVAGLTEEDELVDLIHAGPSCPDDFAPTDELGLCVKVITAKKRWHTAKNACIEADASLMMPKDEATSGVLDGFMDKQPYWIGLSDLAEEGVWKWLDGDDVLWNNWNSKEPNGNTHENCVCTHFGKQQGWNDGTCDTPFPFVCTKPKGDPMTPRWIGLSDRSSLQTFSWSDNSPVKYTHWDSGFPNKHPGEGPMCVFVDSDHGAWHHTKCEEQYKSICKKPEEITDVPPDQYGCQMGQLAYLGSCYEVNFSWESWPAAEADCAAGGGHLVSIHSEYEQSKLTTIIAENRVHFYIGLKFNPDSKSFEWSTGEAFTYQHWAEYEPDLEHHNDDGSGMCVFLHDRDDIGYWSVVRCSEEFAYICEYPRHGYTEPPTTPSSTPPPEAQCPGGPDDYTWTKYNDHCYKYFDAYATTDQLGRSFDGARKYCASFGGDLVSYSDSNEEFYATQLVYSPSWIGYRQEEGNEDDGNGYTWVDGSVSGYENWAADQPNSHDGKENCVGFDGSVNGAWHNMNCVSLQGFICEVVAGVSPSTIVPPTIGPDIPCEELGWGWIAMPGSDLEYCYLFHSSKYGLDGKSWDGAEANCTAQGAHLASVHSIKESNFLMVKMNVMAENILWLGLNSLSLEEGYHWSDGTTLDFTNWRDGEPNDASDQESCVHMIGNGYWNDENCGSGHAFVCKKPKNGEWTTELTTPYPKGHCPTDWVEYHGHCYKLFGDVVDTKLNWTSSRTACIEQTPIKSRYADLASIHSGHQMAFLVAEMQAHPAAEFWIGLNSEFQQGVFAWCDETKMDYDHWAMDEPNGANYGENCVEMIGILDHFKAGQWNDIACNKANGYVCQMKASTDYPTQAPDWIPCSNSVLESFISMNDNCYKLMADPMVWEDAESACAGLGENVHLASVLDIFEESLLMILGTENNLWIGLQKNENKWHWSDGWPMTYTNWFTDSPDTDNLTCAIFSTENGKWVPEWCTQSQPYVCKWTNQTTPTTSPGPGPGDCPDGWTDVGGKSCYMIMNTYEYQVNWFEAGSRCWQMQGSNGLHGELASFHSEEELGLVNSMANPNRYNYWIGLSRNGHGVFTWKDNTPFDFNFWMDGEPNSQPGDGEDCIEAYYGTGQWNDAACSDLKGFICMTDKLIPPTTQPNTKPTTENPPTRPTPDTTTTPGQWTTKPTEYPPKTTSSRTSDTTTTPEQWTTGSPDNRKTTPAVPHNGGEGLNGGGVAAIVISILIVVGLLAVFLYVLRNRDWDVRRLLPPRANSILAGSSSTSNNATFSNIAYNTNSNTVKTNLT